MGKTEVASLRIARYAFPKNVRAHRATTSAFFGNFAHK